jgi:hypothetical protein
MGPVIAPVLVSVGLILAGLWVVVREGVGRPYCASPGWWGGIIVGGLLVILAFCWDWRNVADGNMPNPFRWDLFLLGLVGGFTCFVCGARKAK